MKHTGRSMTNAGSAAHAMVSSTTACVVESRHRHDQLTCGSRLRFAYIFHVSTVGCIRVCVPTSRWVEQTHFTPLPRGGEMPAVRDESLLNISYGEYRGLYQERPSLPHG
jgi:hypothetical protein